MQEKRRLSLDSVFNVEHSDSLGLHSNLGEVGVSRDLGLAQEVVINSFPLDLSVKHFLDVHVASQGLFSDGVWELWHFFGGDIGIIPESLGNLSDVDCVALRLVLRGEIMKIF